MTYYILTDEPIETLIGPFPTKEAAEQFAEGYVSGQADVFDAEQCMSPETYLTPGGGRPPGTDADLDDLNEYRRENGKPPVTHADF